MIDPGDEPDRLLAAVDALGVSVEAILLTHTHFDHIGAVAPVARATGAPVYCPEIERPVLADVMSWVPPGFGPFDSYEADHTVTGGGAGAGRHGHRGAPRGWPGHPYTRSTAPCFRATSSWGVRGPRTSRGTGPARALEARGHQVPRDGRLPREWA
jgi:hypothetical protein